MEIGYCSRRPHRLFVRVASCIPAHSAHPRPVRRNEVKAEVRLPAEARRPAHRLASQEEVGASFSRALSPPPVTEVYLGFGEDRSHLVEALLQSHFGQFHHLTFGPVVFSDGHLCFVVANDFKGYSITLIFWKIRRHPQCYWVCLIAIFVR